MAGTSSAGAVTDESGRPTMRLPFSHLLRISAYWLGLTAIDAGVNIVVQNRVVFDQLVPELEVGRTLFLVGLGGAILGIFIQPTVGAISDYTVSRWGRRKPWIVIGSLLDVVFLAGIGFSNSLVAIAAFVLLLAFSTNIARGPFQGYVPDLVPSRQVGLASAMVGLMQILGNVTGFGIATLAAILTGMEREAAALEGRAPTDYLPLALIAIALVELVTMVSVVLRVGKGIPPKDRGGKSWRQIAREAWATDILRERSYVWLVVSRLFFLTGGSILFNTILVYMKFSLGLGQEAANSLNLVLLVVIVVANLLAIVPAARLSDRFGRKPIIYASLRDRRRRRGARGAGHIHPHRGGRSRPLRRLGRDVPLGRLGADDRHHSQGLGRPVHGLVQRRHRRGVTARRRDRRHRPRPGQHQPGNADRRPEGGDDRGGDPLPDGDRPVPAGGRATPQGCLAGQPEEPASPAGNLPPCGSPTAGRI